MIARFVRTLVALALTAGVSLAQAGPYTITTMDLAGAINSQGWDINNQGDFVGSAQVNGQSVGFVRNGASTVILSGPLGALGAASLGISDTGTVVGSYYNVTDGDHSGFIFSAGNYTTLNYPGASYTQLRGISADGRYVTGFAINADGSYTSFVYDMSNSQFTAIATNTSLTIAQGVTNAGLVVGSRRLTAPTRRVAFTYDLGTATLSDFEVAGATSSRYRGINEAGLIDGWFTDANGAAHGLIGTTALHEVLDVAGAADTYLEGINDAGWLSGSYADDAGFQHAFLARAVSEPAAWALMLAAIGGLSVSWRRRCI